MPAQQSEREKGKGRNARHCLPHDRAQVRDEGLANARDLMFVFDAILGQRYTQY